MSQPANQPLTFYPAYCYPASPTYFLWVKLTAHDIHHHLRTRGEQHQSSTGNPLYFYLNHPIQFIQITGVVVAVEDYHPHIFLFTLDDSSGSTIDVVWRKPKPEQSQAQQHNANNGSTTSASSLANNEDPSTLLPLLQSLQPSTTILVKGTLTTFRSQFQLSLLRLHIITPAQELRLISSRTNFLLNTLSRPWTVAKTTQSKLLARATGEASKETDRAIRARKRREHKAKREKKDAQKIERMWSEEEKRRAEEGEKMKGEGERVMSSIREKRRLRDERS